MSCVTNALRMSRAQGLCAGGKRAGDAASGAQRDNRREWSRQICPSVSVSAHPRGPHQRSLHSGSFIKGSHRGKAAPVLCCQGMLPRPSSLLTMDDAGGQRSQYCQGSVALIDSVRGQKAGPFDYPMDKESRLSRRVPSWVDVWCFASFLPPC